MSQNKELMQKIMQSFSIAYVEAKPKPEEIERLTQRMQELLEGQSEIVARVTDFMNEQGLEPCASSIEQVVYTNTGDVVFGTGMSVTYQGVGNNGNGKYVKVVISDL